MKAIKTHYFILSVTTLLLISFSSTSANAQDGDGSVQIGGEMKQWHDITLTLNGPHANESDIDPNPFLDYRFSVQFTHESGSPSYRVPGYFAADGDAANSSAGSGNKWRAHLTPDKVGKWTYKVSFAQGEDIAIDWDQEGETISTYHGKSGSFGIHPTDKPDTDFRQKGRLEYIGEHYLRFAGSKEYFLKGGADSPENFLAYKEFDQTYDDDAGSGSYEEVGTFIHSYEPHLKDWNEDDPTWKDGKGKDIIGMLNYLASEKMNSVYFITYNLDGGDGRDSWMWTSPDVRKHFDCSKLDQWEIVFDHMDKLGIMLHVVTQETENDGDLGGSLGLNPIRKLYYRELAARYSHHLALIWNLGEENNTPDEDRKDIARYIRSYDPYDHPITVHTKSGRALTFYDGLIGDPYFEATSIQGPMKNYNNEAIVLRERTAEAGRKWAIFGDEQSPASHGVVPDDVDPTHDKPRKEGLWGNLMGGGSGVEWYFGHQFAHMDINCEDWRSRENMWDQTRYALQFFQDHLPFWEMEPRNELTSQDDDYVFALPGQIYAIYLPNGGSCELDLEDHKHTFQVKWYNPRAGGGLKNGSVTKVTGPSTVSLGEPPSDIDQDWTVLVKRTN